MIASRCCATLGRGKMSTISTVLKLEENKKVKPNYKRAKEVFLNPAPIETKKERNTRHVLISVISFMAGAGSAAGFWYVVGKWLLYR